MALFSAPKNKLYIARFLPVLLLAVAIAAFAASSNAVQRTNTAQERTIVEHALNRSITQCYALEGAYPPDLLYLCDNYGFLYNSEHFFIDYRYIGANLRPDVTIIERENE